MTSWYAVADTVSDRAFAALLALLGQGVLSAIAPPLLQMVRRAMNSAARRFYLRAEVKLNKANRSVASRRWRGGLIMLATLTGIGVATSSGWAFLLPDVLTYGSMLLLLVVAPLFGVGGAASEESGDLRRHAEILGETACEWVTPMLVWYLLLGLPGVLLAWLTRHAYGVLGLPIPRLEAFGAPARVLHAWVCALPSLGGALLLCASAVFVRGTHPRAGWRMALSHPRHLGAATMAGVLGIALLGPREEGGEKHDLPWVGDGSAKLTPADGLRAVRVYRLFRLLVLTLLAAGSLI